MSVETQAGRVPTLTELLERIGDVGPILERNTDETERNRRVVDENIEALTAAGAFKVTVPRRFGGFEMSLRDKLEVSAAVGEHCGSTAWVVALINVCNWMASLLPDKGREEIFADTPDVKVAGVLNATQDVRKADGGFVVSGSWPWASGSWHADWALLGIAIVDDQGAEIDQALAFVPMSEVSIEETWFVAGMKGTGSNTMVAEEVFIPEHRMYSVSRALEGVYACEHPDGEPSYRSSFMPLLTLILVGPQLGMGRAALRFVEERAPKRGITYTKFERQTDSVAFQLQIARAATMIDGAHLHAFRAADDVDQTAAAMESMPYLRRARARADAAYGIGQIKDAIDLLVSAHGASSFAEVSPLQRIWRDSNTAARHAVADLLVNQEIYGKARLGIPYEENITPLI